MTIEALIGDYGLAAVFLGAGIEGETMVLAGGLFAHEGMLSLPGAAIAAAAGSFVADQCFFAAGRRFRDHRWVRRAQAKPAFARALDTLERYPVGFIFAFRFLYGLRTVSPIAIGTSHVPTRTFLWINAVAAMLWGALFTGLGYVFGTGIAELLGRYRPHGRQWLWVAGAAVLLGFAFGAIRWWRRRDG
ncbi:membrane protein DedA with SNARE-associated domain [Sphingomonas insulae]|uniref:DedA family protein n=1 Tax=Sphingomonas insulae TaxID=424800 RepID=A0ABP3SSB4_9SPHN|nr:DedA family protein [Sphingomonas insulae]NIJ30349.1 membrane protein DedA with SNARE-associated domain [Sphingomonas insulae]